MQLANKQDWARYHSYEVHQMAELVDSHMRPGPWQKVGYFRKVRLRAHSHYLIVLSGWQGLRSSADAL